jgi:DNA-binding winged helix-turn-helix (wHTH) protein
MLSTAMAELFFGDFRFDTRRLQLEGLDGVVEVRAKALELLTYLIQNRNRFVPRDEIVGALWKDVTVTSSSLTQCVSELRQVLGDSPREPRYIETRVKLGYRFVATVYHRPTEQLVPLPPPSHEDHEEKPSSTRWRGRKRWFVAAAAMVATLSAAALLQWYRPAATPALPTLVVVMTTIGSEVDEPARQIVVAAQYEILRRLAELEGFSVTTGVRNGPPASDLEVELTCSRWQEAGFELNASLRRAQTGEVAWGWTWSISDDSDGLDALVDEVASRVMTALHSRAAPRG